MLTTMLDTYY